MKILGTFYLLTLMAVFPVFVHAQTANSISIQLDDETLTTQCKPGAVPRMGTTVSKDSVVGVRVSIQGKTKGTELKYEVTGGKVKDGGQAIEWDLTDMEPGTYQITATQYMGRKPIASNTAVITVEGAECISDCSCPAIEVLGPTEAVKNDTLQEFVAKAYGWDATYNWTVENGEIISGQGTRKLTVRVNKKDFANEMKVTVEFGGLESAKLCFCAMSASASARIID